MNDKIDSSALNAAGFNCRWQPVVASQGAVLSLIVRSQKDEKVFLEVLEKVDSVFGPESDHHPLTVENLKLSLNIGDLSLESLITTKSPVQSFRKTISSFLENTLGILKVTDKFAKNILASAKRSVANSDFKKFDGSLKMVAAGSLEQIAIFEKYLEKKYQDREIFYGIHQSSSSLITCLVFTEADFEVHFVDGSDGGYAYAAKGLKKQLKHHEDSKLKISVPA